MIQVILLCMEGNAWLVVHEAIHFTVMQLTVALWRLYCFCRVGVGADRSEEPAGPPVQGIECETDIFRVLKLSYVPPHKRFFHDYQ